jgi:hypothetical protein
VCHTSLFARDLFCALSRGLVYISNTNPACSCVYICKLQFRPIHPPSRRLSPPDAASPASAVRNSSDTKEAGVAGVLGRSGWSREVGEGLGNLVVRAKPWWSTGGRRSTTRWQGSGASISDEQLHMIERKGGDHTGHGKFFASRRDSGSHRR